MKADSTHIIEEFRGDTLVPRKLLRAITKRIVDNIDPEKIILFGSYAYGEPTLDSDIDLLVIMKSDKRPIEEADNVSRLFPIRYFGMDILVRTPKMIKERIALGDVFIEDITSKGKVLYERRKHQRTRLGRQSGNGLRGSARPQPSKKKPTLRQGRIRLRTVR